MLSPGFSAEPRSASFARVIPEAFKVLATHGLKNIRNSLSEIDDELTRQEHAIEELTRLFGEEVANETTGVNRIDDVEETMYSLEHTRLDGKAAKNHEYSDLHDDLNGLEATVERYKQGVASNDNASVAAMLSTSHQFANYCTTTKVSAWDNLKDELSKTDLESAVQVLMCHADPKQAQKTAAQAWHDTHGTAETVSRGAFREWWVQRKVLHEAGLPTKTRSRTKTRTA